MNIKRIITHSALALFLVAGITSCEKEEIIEEPTPVALNSKTITYDFNSGQLASDFAYVGTHINDLNAQLKLDELVNGGTKITVTLNNTIDGETYHIHAHDMADSNTTPNNTPYDEAPNATVFAKFIVGNGSSMSVSFDTDKSFTNLTTIYDGFFVVHDPLQDIDTANPASFVILGVFGRD